MKAVILAAGLGTRLEPLTRDLPKCMVPVAGVPIVDRMIARIAEAGIDELVVVGGHLQDVLRRHLERSGSELARRAHLVENDRYAEWGNFYSLLCAEEAIGGDSFIKLDADVLLDRDVLPRLLAADGPGVLAIDRKEQMGDEEMKARVGDDGRIVELSKRIPAERAFGESIGVERIDAELSPRVFSGLRRLIEIGETHEYYERAYELLIEGGVRFGWADVTDCSWCEIDDPADLERAAEILAAQC